MARSLLPPVEQHVSVTLASSTAVLLGLVDHVTADADPSVVLREPVTASGARVLPPVRDEDLLLQWTSAAGRHELVTSFTGLLPGRVPLWRLLPRAEPRTVQDRRYARAGDALPAVLERSDTTWSSVVADLSEGGARCVVDCLEITIADRVVLHLEVEGQSLHLAGRVLAAVPTPDGRCELRLEFGDIGRAEDVVRRRVLAQQRRARAVAR